MAGKHKHDDEKVLKASAQANEETFENKAESENTCENNSCCSCSNSGDYKGC